MNNHNRSEEASAQGGPAGAPNVHIVILAGGVGTRFWPMSRVARPKQFLAVKEGGESLIQWTVRRIRPFVKGPRLWVVTNPQQAPLVQEHVPDARVLAEPVGRNTTASIMFAAAKIHQEDPNSVMVVLPADHAVADEEKLREAIQQAVSVASQQPLLVTIGITPTFANTAYGYIQVGRALGGGDLGDRAFGDSDLGDRALADSAFAVNRFYEKPNLDRAKQYFESGSYLWNSGMFCWHTDVILHAFAEHAPNFAAGADALGVALGTANEEVVLSQVFAGLESISIDFSVLEHAKNCAVIKAEPFGWNDVGSWDSWADLQSRDANGNMSQGDVMLLDSKGSIVVAKDRLIALVGVQDIVVIDAGDAMLVVPRDRAQDVKKVVEELQSQGRRELI